AANLALPASLFPLLSPIHSFTFVHQGDDMLYRLPKVFQAILINLMILGMGWPSALPLARAAEVPQAVDGNLNISDEGEGTGGISGTVTRADTGEPLQDAEIHLETIYGTRITGAGSNVTDENGFYEITDLPGGM